ncbi:MULTISPECIES: TetR/AcrR family transcriptional regulator [unclassified Parafrankia]|uniref:TetR/AcrR family transcriptional regulator n=1 Tax=Parafrankia TaxID=2994362 RepID=UPI0000541675|nr:MULTISPECIES: TetR/AcrR family transcriptional regulator [unclassified Parafrankia]ABW10048.1 transcriptional regulator, TetR family [Frankia sp. EAN1pec]CAI7980922.1 Transcriptional regulator, TetR family [Frankia sp. Hr75.2]SQD97248.1 Transcriptional regulator, TetR family [Parafrankia sp. Ea1.12]
MTVQRRAGAARERVLAVALELFARNGVSGTSIQMIADELGVTKAAVYFQFNAKEELLRAVVAPALEEMRRVTEAAEARRRPADQLSTALTGVVDMIINNSRLNAVVWADPAVSRLTREDPILRDLVARLDRILAGPDPDVEALVTTVMVSGGLMAATTDPRLADLDKDVLRRQLLNTARRMLGLRAIRTQV